MLDQQTLEAQIEEMTDEGMIELLKELGDSTFFAAIIRHSRQRSEMTVAGMWSIDPVNNPSLIARYQGVKAGLDDLEGTIRAIEDSQKAKEKEANEKIAEQAGDQK